MVFSRKIKTLLLLNVFLFLSCFVSYSYAQSNKAVYREKVREGNLLLTEKNYSKALENFLEAYEIDSSIAYLNYRIGLCYLNSVSEKKKAIAYLKRASLGANRNYDDFDPNEKSAPNSVFYYLGQAQLLNYEFDEANNNLQKFKTMLGSNENAHKEVGRYISNCITAKDLINNPAKVKIDNLGPKINTPYPEYCPIINADESILLFTSRRDNSTGEEKTMDGQFYEDIYLSYRKGEEWSAPEPININTNGNDAAISISAGGNQLFVYKDVNGGDIFVSQLEGDSWSDPEPLKTDESDVNDINTEAWETHACVSADGSALYFVSDRKGGYGGRDIYRCVKLPNGKWSKATNLGPGINTEFDEDAPFIHPDGVTLFFSSNGHKGMGGFDIFYSSRKEKDKKERDNNWKWSTPVNMSSPINTPDDDIFYVQSTDGKRAYYSSAKADGFGEKDLYLVTTEEVIVEPTVLLRGHITSDGKVELQGNPRIVVTDQETGSVIHEIRPNSKTGKYVMILNPGENGKTYTVSYEAEGFQPHVETIKIEPGSAFQVIERALDLRSINLERKELGTLALTGSIKGKDGKVVPGASIIIKDNKTGELIDTYYSNPSTGVYHIVLNKGENYSLAFEANGFLFHSENINTPKEKDYSLLTKDIELNPLETGAKIVLNNIFFDSNKSILRNESNSELEKLYKLLADNPNLIVEISGHTDSRGSDALNKKLSQARAQSVVDYLSNEKSKIYRIAPYYYKGIEKKRMIAKGYGPSMPIAPNKLPNGKPDLNGMQLNRRVEFKILSTGIPDQVK